MSEVSADKWSGAAPDLDGPVLNLHTGEFEPGPGDLLKVQWLAAGDDASGVREASAQPSAIAIEFPKSADGRGYSTAAILRNQLGFEGTLWAVGDVAIDQLGFLRRVGFDFVRFADTARAQSLAQDVQEVLKAFSESYQGAYDQPLPYFRRRASTGVPI